MIVRSRSQMTAMRLYPAFLNLEGRRCLVVGGGAVGTRKAKTLLEAGAKVRLVCLEPKPADASDDIEWLCEAFEERHLEGVCIVIAAATEAVNRRVIGAAISRGIWANSASEPERGSFIVPASGTQGRVQIAVSTNGASPRLAAELRDRLIDSIEDAFAEWVELLAELRSEIVATFSEPQRGEALRSLADPCWLERIREVGREGTRAEMRLSIKNSRANS